MAAKFMICPILGCGRDLPLNKLPTREDVLLYWMVLGKNMGGLATICRKTKEIWQTIQIPTVSYSGIYKKINILITEYQYLFKQYNRVNLSESVNNKVAEFKMKNLSLFDIAACKCVTECNCPEIKKCPEIEKIFLKDQRLAREMNIRSTRNTRSTTNSTLFEHNSSAQVKSVINNTMAPKENLSVCAAKQRCCVKKPVLESESDSEMEEDKDITYVATIGRKRVSTQNRKNVKKIGMICDRFGVSNSAGAAIASTTLEVFGLLGQSKQNVIDPNKLRRSREKSRSDLTR